MAQAERVRGHIERVLIVAKTHMSRGVCVSGLTRETNRSVRLLTPRREHQPIDTPYDVGQVWQIEYRRMISVTPPHVEDVRVMDAHYFGVQPAMRETLLRRVKPWCGEPGNLYDGHLVIGTFSAYINRAGGVPRCSTGYWLPEQPLTLTHINEKAYYQIAHPASNNEHDQHFGVLSIRYVGFADPISEIPAQTLVRVSLSRWWKKSEADEERCYLQLSGWYDVEE